MEKRKMVQFESLQITICRYNSDLDKMLIVKAGVAIVLNRKVPI